MRINVGISRVCCAKLYYLNDVSFFILPVLFLLAETTRSAWWPCSPWLGKNFPCGRAFYGEVWVQIFCLINYAPLHNPPIKLEQIKLGQLTFLTKWDNSDFNTHVTETLTLKSPPFFFFFFFHSFNLFSLFSAFGFFFFSLLHVVWVNKNSFEFCLLPQLLFLIWTLPSIVSLYSFLPKCFRLLLLFLYAT